MQSIKNLRPLLFVFLVMPFYGFSQSDSLLNKNDSTYYHSSQKVSIALITGYHLQKNRFAEIGIGKMIDGREGYHPITIIYGISNEIKLSKNPIWGLKVVGWSGGGVGGINMGINLINYTDFKENSLRFRPEIGVGVSIFRIVYGYNSAITNKDFEGINKHNFGLNLMINLKTLKEY